MSYELVDAVNQQCVLEKGATDLLILTKFAEMVADPRNPVRRVGIERFMAITRLDRRTVQRHLHGLHDCGLLVCLDGDDVRRDYAKLYKLNLPEGFDPEVVKSRRLKYYGGKPFCPVFAEDNSGQPDAEMSLPPITRDVALSGGLGKLTKNLDKLPKKLDKLPKKLVKLPPYNNIIKKEDNNNDKEGVVVEAEVSFVLRQAAKVTGGTEQAFAHLGITSGNAKIALDAIRYFAKAWESNPDLVKSKSVLYLSKVIEEALKTNGGNLVTGRLEPPKTKGGAEGYIDDAWQDFMFDGHKLNILGQARAGEIWHELKARVASSSKDKKFKDDLDKFIARFKAANPVPPDNFDALDAALRAALPPPPANC